MYITYKKLGETPLQALERVRGEQVLEPSVPMTYAGRLDPLAEGVLIILAGDECKDKDQYLGLDKTYVFEALVGFATDSYDILGLVTTSGQSVVSDTVVSALHDMIGTNTFQYPDYSSKPVAGQPLFMHARAGTIADILKPEREMKIYDAKYVSDTKYSRDELLRNITERINTVSGDFRQDEILTAWQNTLAPFSPDASFVVIRGELSCASGTYVRTIIHELGRRLGVPMCLYSLVRTKVGEYSSGI